MSIRLRSSLFFTLFCFIDVDASNGNMKKLMELHEVVPDIIPEAPQLTLNIIYEGGITVENGVELTPTQVKNQPTVTWEPDFENFYTLIMVTPDAPSRAEPTLKELQLWIVVNIPANNISKGDIISEYMSPGPPQGTGLHRYVSFLYKQRARMAFDEERLDRNSLNQRFYFSTQKFAEKHNLGVPIAGNIFQAQFDDYVPELYKQIGWN